MIDTIEYIFIQQITIKTNFATADGLGKLLLMAEFKSLLQKVNKNCPFLPLIKSSHKFRDQIECVKNVCFLLISDLLKWLNTSHEVFMESLKMKIKTGQKMF